VEAENLPWIDDESTDLFFFGVDPLGEPMLNGLGRSIYRVGNGELVAKIYELGFKKVKDVDASDAHFDDI
jgi:ATP-dependent RNA circularization protein (DNA/RNA ligase family)